MVFAGCPSSNVRKLIFFLFLEMKPAGSPRSSLGALDRLRFLTVCFVLFLATQSLSAFSQNKTSAANTGHTPSALEGVLTQMDAAAAKFRSAEADFTWDQYQKVVNETDTQKGKIYFRRTGKGETQTAVNIQSPDQKYVIVTDGKIRVYQPRIEQVNEYDAGQNRAEVESFLALGFGKGGHDLEKQYEVKFDGNEDVDGVKTAKLELTPKSPKVKNMFDKIVIWVDATRAVSLKQQAFEPSGDYRLSHYTNIKVNSRVPDDVFKLHISGHVKTVKGS